MNRLLDRIGVGLIVAAVCALGPLVVAQPFTGTFTTPCTFIEAQTWWTPVTTGKTSHVHVGGCLPLYRDVRGQVPIRLEYKLHNANGVMERYDGPGGVLKPFFRGNGEHLIDGLIVERVLDTTLKNSAGVAPTDGTKLVQFEGLFNDENPDEAFRKVRIRGHWRYANGAPGTPTTATADLAAHAWFAPSDTEGRGYSNAILAASSIPRGPIKGIWYPKVKFANSTGHLSYGFVSIDPDVHNGSFGTELFNAAGLSGNVWHTIPVDTSKLTVGSHKIFIKTSDHGKFPKGTLAGILVVGFEVTR